MKLGEITVFFAVRVRKYYRYFSRLHYQYHSTYPGPNWCLLPILLPKFGEHNLSLKRVTAFYPTQKMNFSVKEFFSKCDQIRNSSLFDPIYWRNLNGKLRFLYSTIKATWYYMTSSVSFKLIWFGLVFPLFKFDDHNSCQHETIVFSQSHVILQWCRHG